MPGDVTAVGHALLRDHDWDVVVLDLVFDSVLDDPAGLVDEVRTLRFARGDCVVELDVRGHAYLTVDVRVRPAGAVTVAALVRGPADEGTSAWVCGRHLSWLPAGLTSFLVHWPDGDRCLVRTAWVPL